MVFGTFSRFWEQKVIIFGDVRAAPRKVCACASGIPDTRKSWKT